MSPDSSTASARIIRAHGRVEAVESVPLGSQLAADAAVGALSITVVNAVDFPATGTVSLNDDLLDYTGVDDTTGTITLASGPTAAADEGDTVAIWDPFTLNVATEKRAWVQFAGDDGSADPVVAIVTQGLVHDLDDGIRGEAGESVLLEHQYGIWRVIDALGFSQAPLNSPVQVFDDTGAQIGAVNDDGTVTGSILSYADSFALGSETAFLDGVSLGDVLDGPARGTVPGGVGYLIPTIVGIGNTEYGIMEIDPILPDDAPNRDYEISILGNVSASAAPLMAELHVRKTSDGTTPTINSATIVPTSALRAPVVTTTDLFTITGSLLWRPPATGLHRLLLTVRTSGPGTLTAQGAWVIAVKDLGQRSLSTAATNNGGGTLAAGGTDTTPAQTAQPATITRYYDCTDGHWWTGGGTLKLATDKWYFGNSSATPEGNRKIAMWFNDSKIRSDLAGATVVSVQVKLFLFDGGQDNNVSVGTHGDSTVRTDWGNITGKNTDRVRETNWSQGSSRWVDLPNPDEWRTGASRGVVVGPSPFDTDKWAGGIYGAGRPSKPQLKIVYKR